MSVFVRYFIPEDGDDQQHPNIYSVAGASGNQGLTLRAVKQNFPLPGLFHFRFLHAVGGSSSDKVWLDVLEDEAVVPVVDEAVFAKISRIVVTNGSSANNNNNNNSGTYSNSSSSSNGLNGKSGLAPISTLQASEAAAVKQRRPTSEKLISFDTDGSLSPVAKTSVPKGASLAAVSSGMTLSSGSDDLIGFNAAMESANAQADSSRSSSNIDLFGLDSLQPVQAASMQQQQHQQQHQQPISRGPSMSAMGGMVRPAPPSGFGGDPFASLGQTTPRTPSNPYQQQQLQQQQQQQQQQQRPPTRPF